MLTRSLALFLACFAIPATAFVPVTATTAMNPTAPARQLSSHQHQQQESGPTARDGSRPADASRIAWVVRPALPSDEQEVTKLLRASYGQLLANDYPSDLLDKALPLFGRANPSLLKCPTWFVALHPATGHIVGCGGWTPHSPTSASKNSSASGEDLSSTKKMTPHVRHFATDPKYARQGIGAAIWKRVMDSLRQDKLGDPNSSALEMEVYSTRTAVPFYESCGFIKVHETSVHLSPDCEFPCWLLKGTFSLKPDEN